MIETERLILRPFRKEDAADLYEYLREPSVHCFVSMKVEDRKQAEEEALKRAKDADLYLAVALKENGKVIGEIFAYVEGTDPDSEIRDNYSPCWMMNPTYTGKGYGYEAAHAYIDYLFREKGARQEGLFREFVSFINDENGDPIYENTYQYAILKKEWKG